MPLKEMALNALRGIIGTAEDPPKSNHNWITESYADVSGQAWARRGNPWCAMTLTWVLRQAGFDWFIYAYCPYVERDAKNGVHGMSWGDEPQPDALVLYDLEGSGMATHIGMVETVYGDGVFDAIEGNWGDKVTRLRRDMKYVRGFVYMPFDSPSTPEPTPKEKDMSYLLHNPAFHNDAVYICNGMNRRWVRPEELPGLKAKLRESGLRDDEREAKVEEIEPLVLIGPEAP